MTKRSATLARGVAFAAALLALVLWLATPAYAAVYDNDPYTDAAWVNSCGTDASCIALAERLESVAYQLETLSNIQSTLENRLADVIANTQYLNDHLPQIRGAVEAVSLNTSSASSETSMLRNLTELHLDPDGDGEVPPYAAGGGVGGALELSAADRERLDLGWWGTWAIVGLLLVLLVAPQLSSLLRTDRGL